MKKTVLISLIFFIIVGLLNCKKKVEKPTLIDFTLKDLQGKEYTLSSQIGKVVIIDFWATWCKPCIASIPIFNALYDKYKDKGLLILGIGLDEKEEALRKFVHLYPINYPVLIGNREVAQKYRVRAIPTTYIIDKKGNIVGHHIGLIPNMQSVLEEEIKKLL